MSTWNPYARPLEHPLKSLALLFLLWKALLLVVAVASPGPGYDTSTVILQRAGAVGAGEKHASSIFHVLGERLALKLTRWDAIYFVKSAERGYLNEQDWAFSWAFSRLIRYLAKIVSPQADNAPFNTYVWAGIAISHVSHLLSVLVLYRLFIRVQSDANEHRSAFLAASLHIVTPAGLFLSAPYGEALFSFLNFSGMLLYIESQRDQSQNSWGALRGCHIIASGALFSMAASIRGNGLLSGLIFVYDVVTHLPRLLSYSLSLNDFRKLLSTTVAGSLIIVGFFGPQWLAYDEYCGQTYMSSKYGRSWCLRYVPSIYSWVQSHYWNVGFLRYWTISNVPLFLIATPLLWVMVQSAILSLENKPKSLVIDPQSRSSVGSVERIIPKPSEDQHPTEVERGYLRRLALPQLVLALMALTNFHVQIINRIASGYPIWYLFIARVLFHSSTSEASKQQPAKITRVFIRWMIMYAIVQGSLFANFLPPA
ncbi:mannosyltransferase [Mytilinidion resinicola]|uniref:GPI mannosyltransferase 2 n=1 Tax=Mytilinidion resinicola TaxID=574789 RepID=A0A6A6YVV6_9PEZI|nr:mannosyltransferase [Mytilinidion resinicola]KAF2812688.1 mannosyltransferase [Mytilinidion resinicola]